MPQAAACVHFLQRAFGSFFASDPPAGFVIALDRMHPDRRYWQSTTG